MKKVLVLASLAFLAFSFGCGGSDNDTAPVENKETAAGMSSAFFAAAGNNLMVASVKANLVNEEISANCIPAGTISGSITMDDETAGSVTLNFNKCGGILCNEGHVFMDGTLTEAFTIDNKIINYVMDGTLSFVNGPEGFENVDTYFVGQVCGIDLTMNIDGQEITELSGEAEIVAYMNDHISGTICGYDWTEVVDIDVEDEAYCATLTL